MSMTEWADIKNLQEMYPINNYKVFKKKYSYNRAPKAIIKLLFNYFESEDIKFNGDLIVIDNSFIEKFNLKNETNLTVAFILHIFQYLMMVMNLLIRK